MKKIVVVFLAIIVAGLIGYSYKSDKSMPVSAGKPVVKIAFVVPMSGNASAYGESARAAAKIFQDNLPADSFFDYKIIFEDTRGKLEDVANIMNRITKTDQIDVVITFLSGAGFIVSGMNKGEFLHFGTGADVKIGQGAYNFFITSNMKDGANIIIKDMFKNNMEKIDMLTVNTSGAKMISNIFSEELDKQKEIGVINHYTVNPDEKDFKILIEKIINENLQALFVNLTNKPTLDIFLKQYKEKNVKIPLYGMDIFSFLEDKTLGEGMKGTGLPTANSDFIQKYKALSHSETLNYADYFALLLDLIYVSHESSKTVDKDVVVKSILKNCTDSVIFGKMKCDEEGVMMNEHIFFKTIKNGKLIDIIQ